MSAEDIEKKYPSLFSGVGKLKDRQIKLHINENVKPVNQPNRRIPFHLRKKVENMLQ